jgi:hypothetical protein
MKLISWCIYFLLFPSYSWPAYDCSESFNNIQFKLELITDVYKPFPLPDQSKGEKYKDIYHDLQKPEMQEKIRKVMMNDSKLQNYVYTLVYARNKYLNLYRQFTSSFNFPVDISDMSNTQLNDLISGNPGFFKIENNDETFMKYSYDVIMNEPITPGNPGNLPGIRGNIDLFEVDKIQNKLWKLEFIIKNLERKINITRADIIRDIMGIEWAP